MEELAQKLEEEGIMRKIQKETKCGNNVGLHIISIGILYSLSLSLSCGALFILLGMMIVLF